MLEGQLQYLSDNPRTIKRAVNLYRFHRFVAYARQASTLPLDVAMPEQIGRWVVVIIRWPHFVPWVQAQQDGHESDGVDQAAARVLALAAKAGTAQAFEQALEKQGIEASWTDDAELWEFLHAATPAELGIELAGRHADCGDAGRGSRRRRRVASEHARRGALRRPRNLPALERCSPRSGRRTWKRSWSAATRSQGRSPQRGPCGGAV